MELKSHQVKSRIDHILVVKYTFLVLKRWTKRLAQQIKSCLVNQSVTTRKWGTGILLITTSVL